MMAHPRRAKRNRQLACKPGSVWLRLTPERGSHSSGTGLAPGLVQPTRMTGPETGWTARAVLVIPIRSCSRWGLPCRPCCHGRGGLLPHPFTLTFRRRRFAFCGTFPGVAPAGRYPAPCFRGARTFLTPQPFGRSGARLPGQLARAPYRNGPAMTRKIAGTDKAGHHRAGHSSDDGCQQSISRAGSGPCHNSAWTPGSCAWRHGRHCTSGLCRRSYRRSGRAPRRGTSSRT